MIEPFDLQSQSTRGAFDALTEAARQCKPLRAPLPGMRGWAAEDSARRRQQRERETRVSAELEQAQADWRDAYARHENAAVRAVLDIHQPHAGYDQVECDECKDGGGGYEAEPTAWQCATFAAINNAPDDPRVADDPSDQFSPAGKDSA